MKNQYAILIAVRIIAAIVYCAGVYYLMEYIPGWINLPYLLIVLAVGLFELLLTLYLLDFDFKKFKFTKRKS